MTRRTPFTILETSPVILWAVILICLITILDVIIKVPYQGAHGNVVDFDAFYLAGQMTWEGLLVDAYDPVEFFARLRALAGQDVPMIWSYPPQYDLFTVLLPLVQRTLAYALFSLGTFAGFVLILRRMAGPYLAGVLILALPMMLITLRVGQNGLLTATLIGLFALGWLNRRPGGGGIALGLMVIKPHLALGLGLLTLVSGRWRLLAIAVAVVIASSAVATLAFGPEVWGAFLDSTHVTTAALREGFYPLYRMTSVYAMAASFGLPAQLAFGLQLGVALIAALSIVLAWRRGIEPRQVMGLTLFATVAVSPYNYDYDNGSLLLGLALLAPVIATRATAWEKLGTLVLVWLCTSGGVFGAAILGLEGQEANEKMLSLGAVGHLVLWGMMWRLLARPDMKASKVSGEIDGVRA